MQRPLLVGESNPYGDDPELALYPLPEHASGSRLAHILGLSKPAYLRIFDRMNLVDGPWSARRAKDAAKAVSMTRDEGSPGIILLGAKVSEAFSIPFSPFSMHLRGHGLLACRVAVLPHPSGRSRLWNDAGSFRLARWVVSNVVGETYDRKLAELAPCTFL